MESDGTATDSGTAAGGEPPLANTALGRIRGTFDDGIAVFKGIRYARAPRFRPPAPVEPWNGVLDATAYGAQAHQTLGTLDKMFGGSSIPMDEECLQLNVFTPAVDDAARPVLVWIHGGAYLTGAGSVPWYHGGALARRGDVVVVTLNYRLGAFGFTDVASLPGGERFADSSNLGIRDQLCALEWVRDHIAAFGGDAANVTVFGESAGGSSVIALLAAPTGRALFHAAMPMSPSITQLRSPGRAARAALDLLAAAGVPDAEALTTLSAADLLAAQEQVNERDAGGALTTFSPWADGDVLPHGAIVAAAAADPRPLVIGTTKDENRLFTAFDPAVAALDDEALLRRVDAVAPGRADEVVAAYRKHFPDHSIAQLAASIATDSTFRVPARAVAEEHAAAGSATWMYWFTFETPVFGGVLGSCHALDVPFVFDNLHRPGAAMFTGDHPDRQRVADAMASAVIGLASRRDPGWPPYDAAGRATMRVDLSSGTIDDPEPDLRRLWDSPERSADRR